MQSLRLRRLFQRKKEAIPIKKDITKLIAICKDELTSAGIPNPELEAREIVAKALGIAKSELSLNPVKDVNFTDEEIALCREFISKRKAGFPLQYILGEWDFYGLTFAVGEGVLIPRSDTEIIIEFIEENYQKNLPLKIIDLCAGSGCIGITLAHLYKESSLACVELSDKAFPYLLRNREKYNQKDNIDAYLLDVLEESTVEEVFFGDKVNIIVANPPYIAEKEAGSLQKELKYEPEMALFAKNDGLLFYSEILSKWKEKLLPGGIVIFEVGYTQSKAVANFFIRENFENVSVLKDYSGNDRVVLGYFPKK